jgi:hypothetical protein
MLSRIALPTRGLLALTLLLGGLGPVACSREAAPPPRGERPITGSLPSTAPASLVTPGAPPTRTTLPDGVVDQPYAAKIPEDGGATLTWSIASGQLPDGLSLGAADGRIAGTPRKVGTFAFTVERAEGAGTGREDLSIRILAARVGAAAAAVQWTGSYDYRLEQRVPSGEQVSTARVTIRLTEDAQGALKGTGEGAVTADLYLSTCPSRTVSPARFHAELAGTRTPTRMELHPTTQSWGPIRITPCPNGGMPGVIGGGKIYKMEEALRALTSGDGAEYHLHDRKTYQSGPYPFTVTHTIVLRREP